ncbi:protein of unknown function [Bowdeniella nasicola]|uniref:IrrE N-terminal-like domain-containing protein n=1 Tax=Bowdeniella nasicola TaxID=208480 RepID=A0A1H3YB23_9ACTO|nr:ImmA/IrrE family metallo-endopeptidase [Bowdeniella nasicola]SEA08128.1 protein of unknown function [Bowdeniella nasicola]
MTIRVEVVGDLLRWAVNRAGWDKATIDRRAPRLQDWIDGKVEPTLKQLEKFARDTHTPFGLLFLQEPPVEKIPIPDMRTMRSQGIERPSADLLDTIYLCQDRQDWYREFARESGMRDLDFVGSATTVSSPLLVAQKLRRALGFEFANRSEFASWSDALRQLIDRIEDLGVLVMVSGIVGSNTHRSLNPEEFRGFALSDPIAPLIFVNGADTKAAQLFTLIHELAHICLGRSALSDASMKAFEGTGDELWCNAVAAEFLVPARTLRSEFKGRVAAEELDRLARMFRASTLVVLKRLFDAGFLEWDAFSEIYDQERLRVVGMLAGQNNGSGGGNFYYTQPLRLSRQFARSVIASARSGSTAYRDAYSLLGTKKHETFENLAAELGVA